MPWLSVIMPLHNGAHYLHETLASVVAEADGGIEFLCYDSSDDEGASREVAQRFADRISLRWRATPRLGSWTAKTNAGVQDARADYIVMLHQDDLWLPGHGKVLAQTVKQMSDQGCSLSIGPSRLVGNDGRDVGKWNLPFPVGRNGGRELAKTLIVQNTIAIPSPVISRTAYLSVGKMDEHLWYSADWDIYLKLALTGDVLVRDRATTAFRLHGGSLTMTGRKDLTDFRAQQETVLERFLPQLAPLTTGVEARARASIAVNCALAAASRGELAGIGAMVAQLSMLGPWRWPGFFRDTRLIDRVLGRLRLKLAGKL